MKPDPLEPGTYTGDYTADKTGAYVTEVIARQDKTELGRDTLTFRREDGVAENFGAAQKKTCSKSCQAIPTAITTRRRRRGGCRTKSRFPKPASPRTTIWISGICRFCSCWYCRFAAASGLLRRKWGVV